MNDKDEEELLANFVSNNENQEKDEAESPHSENLKKLKKAADQNIREKSVPLNEARAEKADEVKGNINKVGLGFLEVPVETLPTQGLFYPVGTRIMIRAANGGEIRHWSTTNEQDLSDVDDALNYMLERCLTVSLPDQSYATWRDLKDIDRFYLILSIRDFTFGNDNLLKIKISETSEQEVHKDDIEFIKIPEKIMQHYDPEKRCFVFDTKSAQNPKLNVYMPSVGVTQWLKGYIKKKEQRQEGYDKDFVTLAPLIIKDYRNLTDNTYEKYINQCMSFGVYEYSLLASVKKIIESSISPKMKYIDKDGAEQETPLNFQGGIKSIFLLDVDSIFDI